MTPPGTRIRSSADEAHLDFLRELALERESPGGPPPLPPHAWRESTRAKARPSFVAATARTPRSFKTAIRADVAESEAYKRALASGEIGLQRPNGANRAGPDFITARRRPDGTYEIVVTDVKSSSRGVFPRARLSVPVRWMPYVRAAVADPLGVGDLALAQAIRAALAAGHTVARQVNVNYSPAPAPRGQGYIS